MLFNDTMNLLENVIPDALAKAKYSMMPFSRGSVSRQYEYVKEGKISSFVFPDDASRAASGWQRAKDILDLDKLNEKHKRKERPPSVTSSVYTYL